MAVTYAWRLDANKYAYILSPDSGLTGEKRYGYANSSPVVGDSLNMIATTANEWFGEGGKYGFSGYKKAYDKMIEAIKDEWGEETQYYDLLSADVYYNVDSTNCAELKGVGIKGIKFLGTASVESFNINNPTWNTNGKVSDPGVFLVYGIYMEDQDDDPSKVTPENIFVVKNGTNGTNADGSSSTADLETKLNNEIKRSTDADNEMSANISRLTQKVNSLDALNGGDLSDIISSISSLLTRVSTLETDNRELKRRVKELEDWVSSNEDGGSGNDNTTTPDVGLAAIEQLSDFDSTGYRFVLTDGTNLYYENKKMAFCQQGTIFANAFYQNDNSSSSTRPPVTELPEPEPAIPEPEPDPEPEPEAPPEIDFPEIDLPEIDPGLDLTDTIICPKCGEVYDKKLSQCPSCQIGDVVIT